MAPIRLRVPASATERERMCAQAAKGNTHFHTQRDSVHATISLSLLLYVCVCARLIVCETRLPARRNWRWAAARDSRARSVRPTGSSLVRSPRSLARSILCWLRRHRRRRRLLPHSN